jgi:hypothetical protein
VAFLQWKNCCGELQTSGTSFSVAESCVVVQLQSDQLTRVADVFWILRFTVVKVDPFPLKTGSKCVLMLPSFTINSIESTLRGPKMINRTAMQRLL